jgi:hypothetical protein
MKKKEALLIVGDEQVAHVSLITSLEIVAMNLHSQASPTSWLLITPEQRNTSRHRANEIVNEALYFWETEARKRQAPQ